MYIIVHLCICQLALLTHCLSEETRAMRSHFVRILQLNERAHSYFKFVSARNLRYYVINCKWMIEEKAF